jgi:hypothetical protein
MARGLSARAHGKVLESVSEDALSPPTLGPPRAIVLAVLCFFVTPYDIPIDSIPMPGPCWYSNF